ncbi:MAG TPA: CBS domain-containing protein [Methanothermobacter sp.]|nr:CBS-domain-containing protein [Methanothermobacter sp. MT-2]HHW04511.1 CBS domain-containing protein [Methanothermobacter sp.]HOK73073.1 CBS domain-containing protein [Methanothermobacter sp.]HOL69580.1 CBS domain-containing protein [Methanothermobacter sp.]HPQ04597.1 CBS domain-containing protein [Methanothermobacter sp.]
MKVKELMDKKFILTGPDETLDEVAEKMETYKRFTIPVVDDKKRLIGWITSLNVIRGLREDKKRVSEIMHIPEEIIHVHENDPARLAVLEISKHKVVNLPVLDDEGVIVGIVRALDIVKTLSSLYEIKVYKIFEAMSQELKGISWDELMEAAAIITRRRTGERITAAEYEERIKKSTFGEAIWATGGLEKFFVGLIAIGELVIARKVARARR